MFKDRFDFGCYYSGAGTQRGTSVGPATVRLVASLLPDPRSQAP